MTEPDSADASASPPQPAIVHKHVLRTLVASIFGTIALCLILASILVGWLNQTLTNTTVYVSTVAPLAAQPAIQNYVTQKVTSQIISSTSLQNLAAGLLPPSQVASQPASQQSAEVQSIVNQNVAQIVSSPEFAGLWKSTNQSAQQQLISELNNNSSGITLDLHPAVLGVFSLLNSTKLAAINNHLQIPANLGNISLSGSAVPKIHQVYNLFKNGTWLLLIITLLCIGICIWASVHHLKTLRRILVGTGIISLVLAALLKAPGAILSSHHRQGLEQQAILAVVNVLLSKLLVFCLILGIVCLLAAISSKLYNKFISEKKTPQANIASDLKPASHPVPSA